MHTSKQGQLRSSEITVFKNGSMTASLPGSRGAYLQWLPEKLHDMTCVAELRRAKYSVLFKKPSSRHPQPIASDLLNTESLNHEMKSFFQGALAFSVPAMQVLLLQRTASHSGKVAKPVGESCQHGCCSAMRTRCRWSRSSSNLSLRSWTSSSAALVLLCSDACLSLTSACMTQSAGHTDDIVQDDQVHCHKVEITAHVTPQARLPPNQSQQGQHEPWTSAALSAAMHTSECACQACQRTAIGLHGSCHLPERAQCCNPRPPAAHAASHNSRASPARSALPLNLPAQLRQPCSLVKGLQLKAQTAVHPSLRLPKVPLHPSALPCCRASLCASGSVSASMATCLHASQSNQLPAT